MLTCPWKIGVLQWSLWANHNLTVLHLPIILHQEYWAWCYWRIFPAKVSSKMWASSWRQTSNADTKKARREKPVVNIYLFLLQQILAVRCPCAAMDWSTKDFLDLEGDWWWLMMLPYICTELMLPFGYQHDCFLGKEAFYCCEPQGWGLCVFDATCGWQQASWRAEGRTAEDSEPSCQCQWPAKCG